MKTIDFCIPFIGSGLHYTEFLISNLLSTAKYPERISISLSAHSQSDIELIKNTSLNNVVKNVVMAPVPGDTPGARFTIKAVTGSANHCSAIQSLFDQSTADAVIFSDYDMAFLVAGWDQKIIDILEDHDLCGVGYQNYKFSIPIKELTDLYQCYVCYYQQIPNLSFLAITRKCIETNFPEGMSLFHNYLTNGGLPFQIVNTPQISNALNLPLGAIWWLDSGFEIPFVIQENNLKYQTFTPVAFDKQSIFSSSEFVEVSTSNLPDVFIDSHGEPFLAHYGRGTTKTQRPNNNASFDRFVVAVNSYLGK